jgi:hypothetical protein
LWLPHGALNGSSGWIHNLDARECANGTAIRGLQNNRREQRLERQEVIITQNC